MGFRYTIKRSERMKWPSGVKVTTKTLRIHATIVYFSLFSTIFHKNQLNVGK